MRTDIPDNLKNKLIAAGASPIYYLVFHFDNGDEYVSDRVMTLSDGNVTSDLVVKWGTIRHSAALDEAVNGLSVANIQVEIEIANTSATGWFCSKLNIEPIENTPVSMFMTAGDSVEEFLIDKFIIRDPIKYAEDSLGVKITLISILLAQNVTIGDLSSATKDYYGIIVGATVEQTGTPYGVQPFAKLTEAIGTGQTSVLTDRNLATAGFPSSGDVSTGFNIFHYTGLSGNNFTGVSGIDTPVSKDSYICLSNTDITFSYGVGPVGIAEPLFVDGELYSKPYTVNKDSNPVQVTFPGSLPYKLSTEYVTAPVERTDMSVAYVTDKSIETAIYDSFYDKDDMRVFTTHKTDPVAWDYERVFMKSLSIPGIPSDAILLDSKIRLKVTMSAIGDDPTKNSTEFRSKISGKLFGKSFSQLHVQFDPTIYERLITFTKTGCKDINIITDPEQNYFIYEVIGLSFVSPTTDLYVDTLHFHEFYAEITYKTLSSNEKIYTVTTSLSIGSSAGNVNPATLIQTVSKLQSPYMDFDTDSFTNSYNWFEANNYSFAGLIDGGKYCLDVLKDLLFLSRSYITFAGGKAKLHISQLPDVAENKIVSTLDTRKERSINIERQPVDDILNNITLRYGYDPLTELYSSTYNSYDQKSIDMLGIHEKTIDGYLITNASHAQSMTDYWISSMAIPKTIFTIEETMKFLGSEIGDSIIVKTDFSDIRYFTGTIIKFDKIPASSNNVTTYKFTMVGKLNPPPKIFNIVDDVIDVSDSSPILKPKYVINDSAINVTELMVADQSVGWSESPWDITPWSDKAPTSGWGIFGWSSTGWAE